MTSKKKRGRPKGLRPPKRQFPLKLDEETRGKLTAAAYWTRQSANSIIEEGIGIVLLRLQETHNSGKPFPPKPAKAPPSLPLGTHEDASDNEEGRPAPGARPKRKQQPRKAK